MARTENNSSKRRLQKDKLLETATRIRARIESRFPSSGLSQIADQVIAITREALVRAEAISRPNRWLRAGLVVLIAIAIGGVVVYLHNREDQTAIWLLFFQFLDAAKGGAAVLTGLAIFLITLENRLKRWRAIQAVHELRAMAHLIDMHQLAKDPDRLGDPSEPIDVAGKPMTADDVERYWHFCTELLAVISKIGQLYVQDFADAPAQAAVDQFENLATGLSSKIWQKLMILDRVQARTNTAGRN